VLQRHARRGPGRLREWTIEFEAFEGEGGAELTITGTEDATVGAGIVTPRWSYAYRLVIRYMHPACPPLYRLVRRPAAPQASHPPTYLTRP
jgi:hypothetical protein